MICCGQQRTSKFCPDCGNVLTADAGSTLLRHVRSTVTTIQARIKGLEVSAGNRDSIEWRIAKEKKHLVKWQAWEDWIVSMIECEDVSKGAVSQ